MDNPWWPTHMLLSLEHYKTRPLKQTSIIFCYSTQADFIPLTIHYFLFSLILTGLIDYININMQLKEAKQFHNADDNQQQQ